MINEHPIWVLCAALYVIVGVITGVSVKANGAPVLVTLFLAITYPVTLPICLAYEYIVAKHWSKTRWTN